MATRTSSLLNDIKTWWPIVDWHKCISCDQEVRREKVWTHRSNKRNQYWSCCTICAPTKEDAEQRFGEFFQLTELPPEDVNNA